MKISNSMYNVLRDLVEIYLPGLGTLYFSLCGIWGFPYGEQVVGTIAALCVFLGLFLKKSRYEHTKPLPMEDDGIYLEDEEVEAKEVE